MNEIMVYGCKVFGGVDNSEATTDQGRLGAFTTSKSQLNLFKFRPDLMHYRNMWYWLRDESSSVFFALVGYHGDANNNNASNSGGVRPDFTNAHFRI